MNKASVSDKMKFNIIFVASWLFFLPVKSQIIAGDSISAGIYYLNFNGTTISCPFTLGGFYYCDTTFVFDVNQDGTNDVAFYHENLDQPNVDQYYERVNILNSNIQLVVVPLDSGYIDTIKTGNWIDKFQNWRQSQSPYLYLHYYTFTSTAVNDGAFDDRARYFGFRLLEPGDTLYGWFRVSLQYVSGGIDGITLYSYALNKFTNGINTGRRIVPECRIFPNPANDLVIIESETIFTELKIYDFMGRLVTFTKQPLEKYINVGGLASGVYQFQIAYPEGTVFHRVIVQH